MPFDSLVSTSASTPTTADGADVREVEVVGRAASACCSMIRSASYAKAVTAVRTCFDSDSSHTISDDRICSGPSGTAHSTSGVVVQLVGVRRAKGAAVEQLDGRLFARQEHEAGSRRRVEAEGREPVEAKAEIAEQPGEDSNLVLGVEADVGAGRVYVERLAVDVACELAVLYLAPDLDDLP